MSTYKMYELGNADACMSRRKFPFLLDEQKTDVFHKAVAVKTVIRDYFDGKILYPDIRESLEDAFKDIPYKSEEQREVQLNDTLKEINRYLSCEKRKLKAAGPSAVEIAPDFTVIVSPDYWYIDNGTLEVIKIKCSSPNITQANTKEDLGMYSMLKYADELAKTLPPGSEVTKVKATYMFLKKKNDSHSIEKPNFDTDFFDVKGGLNIVYVEDDLDLPFMSVYIQPKLEKFLLGIPAHECSQSDCEKCQLYDICKYEEPPQSIIKEPVVKSAKSLVLTDSQLSAIEYEKGICRINAGAGAGKTMIVALRVATLINKGFKPEDFLLITFTNSGAEEMRTRIALYLDDFGLDADISQMHIKTFNAFGDDVIKEEYASLGFTAPPTVVDDVERSHIIAEMLNEAVKRDYFDDDGKPARNPLKSLNWRRFNADDRYAKGALTIAKKVFNIIKTNKYSVADVNKIVSDLGQDYRFIKNDNTIREIAKLYDEYDEKMRNENLIEFADQEALVFEMLHQNPYYFEKFEFKHIIVDEFQDTSETQIKIVKLFTKCPTFESLMVVGDDSQAIYAFRDTSPEYIIDFEKYIGQSIDDIYLLENHRSTPEIIEFANTINANNRFRIIKDLIATRPSGKPVVVTGFLTPKEEQEYVINDIKAHLENGTKPEDIAIICYCRSELQKMAGLLNKEGIPSVMLNPEPYCENSRVRAAIALCRAIMDSSDTKDVSVYANARTHGRMMTMTEQEIAAANEEANALIAAYKEEEDFEKKKELLMQMLKDIDCDDEVYQKFLDILERKALPKILEYIDEFSLYGAKNAVRRDHSYPGIVLTTAHSSKGLEWPVVYNMISKYHDELLSTRAEAIEERRRLLFVSATRARDELIITGQYTAFGKRGAYVYNRFLVEAYAAVDQDFNIQTIEIQRELRAVEEKQKRAEERKAKLEAEKALHEKTKTA